MLIRYFLFSFFLIACSSIPEVEVTEYYQRVQMIQLGISKADFKKKFPEALPRGAKQYTDGTVEVLFIPIKVWNVWLGWLAAEPAWFYFFEDKLIQFGKPDDWPANPKGTYTLKVEQKK